MSAITIKNLGPIEIATISVPANGGVVVLRGKQGCGKSTALRAVSILGGKSERSLSVRDGQKKGTIEFGGIKLSVSRARQSKSGELEVDSIEGRFDIGRLIDPQIADEERADAARIKQLIALADQETAIDDYRTMIESFGLEVPEEGWPETSADAIEVYGRVKRLCDQMAIKASKDASVFPAEKPEKPKVTWDVGRAQEEVEQAIEHAGAISRAKQLRDDHEKARAKAVKRLEEITANACVIDPEEAALKFDEARSHVEACERKVAGLERELAIANKAADDAKKDHVAAARDLDNARKFASQLEAARQAVESMDEDAPAITDEDLAAASRRVADARAAHENAIRGSQIAAAFDADMDKFNRRIALMNQCEAWRKAASKCELVLAASLPESELRIDGSRLVCKTDRSASEPFGDLSHGERAIIAIGIVSKYLKAGGLATISQEIWSGISPENQMRIHAEARERGIVIVTADVQDSPLTVDVMD